MKKSILKILCIVFIISNTSCIIWNNDDDEVLPPQQQLYDAVTMPRVAFEASTILLPPKTIDKSGKIYIKGDYLFINEPYEGFHVFDNSNPSSPVKLAFLKVLGSTDISTKDDVLYINNATDLIAVKLDLSNNSVMITKRIVGTFPELIAPDKVSQHDTAENDVLINWILNE
jgi:hypothetical protein